MYLWQETNYTFLTYLFQIWVLMRNKMYITHAMVIPVLPLLFIFTFSRPELEPAAGGIKSPICKFKMFLPKFQNIFVQISKCICSNCQIYLRNCCSYFSFSWAGFAGGIKSPICWLGAGCHIFQRTPDFPISSRQDFFEFQKWIYWIFAIYLPFDRLTQTDASTCLMLWWIWCQRSVNESTYILFLLATIAS